MRKQHQELRIGVFKVQNYRGRKAAQDGGNRFFVHVEESDVLVLRAHHQEVRVLGRCTTLAFGEGLGVKRDGCAAVCANQTHVDRNHKGVFAVLPGRGGTVLHEGQGVAAFFSVVVTAGRQARRTRLAVPQLELR